MIGSFELVGSFDMVGPFSPAGSFDIVGSFEPVGSFDLIWVCHLNKLDYLIWWVI